MDQPPASNVAFTAFVKIRQFYGLLQPRKYRESEGIGVTFRAAQRNQRPRGKGERRGPLQAKRAEDFQGLDINFGELLLAYFMRPPRP